MSHTVRDVLAAVESLWPIVGQEDWDNSGLVSGHGDQSVESIYLAVDVTNETVSEALEAGAHVFLSHHPLLLKGLTTMAEDRYKGELLARLIRGGCALVGVHTNGDRVPTGTSVTLADAAGVAVRGPIVPNPLGGGLGVVGTVTEQTLANSPATWRRYCPRPLRESESPETSRDESRMSRCALARVTRCFRTRRFARATSTSRATSGTTPRRNSANRRGSTMTPP